MKLVTVPLCLEGSPCCNLRALSSILLLYRVCYAVEDNVLNSPLPTLPQVTKINQLSEPLCNKIFQLPTIFLTPPRNSLQFFLTSLHWETIPEIALQVPHGWEKSHHSDAAYDFAHITLCAVSLRYYKATVLIQVQLATYQDSHNLPSIATLQSDRP